MTARKSKAKPPVNERETGQGREGLEPQGIITPKVLDELASALRAIPADERELWVKIGHALKTLPNDKGKALWLEWSATCPDKFDEADAEAKWDSFRPISTDHRAVFAEAQRHGWDNPAKRKDRHDAAPHDDFRFYPGPKELKATEFIRDLLMTINTTSGNVEYVDQTTRTNNAAPQAEGALKAESAFAWELKNLPIRTIAHWTKASVQILADAPQLQSIIDTELRYGLALAEENQLLNGDGLSPNLDGLLTNAAAYVADFTPTTETMIDKVGLGMLQVTLADYVPNGVVLHPSDWMRIRLLKNADGEYLLGDPQSNPNPLLFGLPVVATTAIAKDTFLVGDFRRAANRHKRTV